MKVTNRHMVRLYLTRAHATPNAEWRATLRRRAKQRGVAGRSFVGAAQTQPALGGLVSQPSNSQRENSSRKSTSCIIFDPQMPQT